MLQVYKGESQGTRIWKKIFCMEENMNSIEGMREYLWRRNFIGVIYSQECSPVPQSCYKE
jgi:hypothetical protein